jgi:hypothetical protein
MLFFFLIRGCATTGTTKVEAVALKSSAMTLAALAWQPQTVANITMAESDVSCPAGVLMLSNGENSVAVERVPVFISPTLGGRTLAITQELTLTRSGVPDILLGNSLYTISSDNYYFIIGALPAPLSSPQGRLKALLPSSNVKIVPSGTLNDQRIPSTARSVIVVTIDVAPPLFIPDNLNNADAHVYAVQLDTAATGNAIFYDLQDGAWVRTRAEWAGDDILRAGAVVAGRGDTYACAKNTVADRMRRINYVYLNRTQSLIDDPSLSSSCTNIYEQTKVIFTASTNLANDDYLKWFLITHRNDLLNQQDALHGNSGCPVIA